MTTQDAMTTCDGAARRIQQRRRDRDNAMVRRAPRRCNGGSNKEGTAPSLCCVMAQPCRAKTSAFDLLTAEESSDLPERCVRFADC